MKSARIKLATDFVRGDEPCFGLAEVNRVTTIPGAGVRRFQVIEVVRGDQVWTYERDMGPAKSFKTEEFVFPGHVRLGTGRYEVIETVARLQSAADEFRAKYDKPTERMHPPSDLRKEFEIFATRRRDARKGTRRFATGGRAV